jgi:hypothetical protein
VVVEKVRVVLVGKTEAQVVEVQEENLMGLGGLGEVTVVVDSMLQVTSWLAVVALEGLGARAVKAENKLEVVPEGGVLRIVEAEPQEVLVRGLEEVGPERRMVEEHLDLC